MLLTDKNPGIKVLVNRGLLYLELKDHRNALLDLTDAVKVYRCTCLGQKRGLGGNGDSLCVYMWVMGEFT